MNTHFCKVGKIKINASKVLNIKELENIIANFVDDVSKVEFPKAFREAV